MADKKTKSEKVKSPNKEFDEKVAKLKKEKSKEELLEIIQIQPFNHELADFSAVRKALDELEVKYPRTYKVQCEGRDMDAAFGKIKAEKPVEKPEEKSEETE